jgi:hypothetical protein
MILDIPLSLKTVIGAMTKDVIPALSADTPVAVESANLVLAYLTIMADQCDYAFDFEIADLRLATSLLSELVAASDGGKATQRACGSATEVLAAAESLASRQIPANREVKDVMRALREETDALVAASVEDGGPEFRASAFRSVLRHAAPEVLRARVAFRKAGLEADSGCLPDVGTALAAMPKR